MQRLALALIVLAAVVALTAAVASWLLPRADAGGLPATAQAGPVPKIAFALLLGVVLYAAFGGAS